MIKKKKILFIAGNARSLIANRINLINELKNNNCIVEAAVPIEDLLDEVYEIGIKIYTFRLNRGSINPIKCMEDLYEYIDEPYYQHDFNNIIKKSLNLIFQVK